MSGWRRQWDIECIPRYSYGILSYLTIKLLMVSEQLEERSGVNEMRLWALEVRWRETGKSHGRMLLFDFLRGFNLG